MSFNFLNVLRMSFSWSKKIYTLLVKFLTWPTLPNRYTILQNVHTSVVRERLQSDVVSVCVTLSRQETHTGFSSLCQPDILLRLQSNNVNLCFGDWGVSCWFMRQDLQILRHSFCLGEDVLPRHTVYIIQCVWGVVKASAGNSIMLWMAHMSGALLPCSFTLRHGRGDHISTCSSSVAHGCSICNLQGTFLALHVTLFLSLGQCGKWTDPLTLPESSHMLNKSFMDDRNSLDSQYFHVRSTLLGGLLQ